MRVLLEVRDIPLGSTVTKKTGEKPYIIRDDIKIYGSTQDQKETLRELKADAGTRFLVSESGDINIISGDAEMLWHATNADLYYYLERKINGPHQ